MLRASDFYIFGIVLLPVLFIPFAPFDVALQKSTYTALLLGLVLLLYAVANLHTGQPGGAAPPAGYTGVPLVVVAVLSAASAGLSLQSVLTSGFTIGTVGSFVLFAAAILSGSLAARDFMRSYYRVLVFSILGMLALSYIAVVFNIEDMMPLMWPGVSFLAFGGLIISTAFSDGGERRVFFGLCALLFAAFALNLSHPASANLGTLLLIVSLVWQLVGMRRIPVATALATLIFVAIQITGPVSPLIFPADVRPSTSESQTLGSLIFLSNLQGAMLGNGPDTFAAAWQQYHTAASETVVQDTVFKEGSSTFFTWLVTIGFLGVASFFSIFAVLGYVIVRAVLEGRGVVLREPLFIGSCMLVLFFYGLSLIHNLDIVSLLLCGVALGFCFALSTPAAVAQEYSSRSRLASVVLSACAGVSIVGMTIFGLVV